MSDFEYTSLDDAFTEERARGRSEGASQERSRERASSQRRRSAGSAARSSYSTASGAASGATSGLSVSKSQARKLVLVSILVLAVLAAYRSRSGSASVQPDQNMIYRRLWGVAVVGLGLTLTADFAPVVAGPFAVLIMLGSLTNGGDKAIQSALSGLSKSPAPPTPRK